MQIKTVGRYGIFVSASRFCSCRQAAAWTGCCCCAAPPTPVRYRRYGRFTPPLHHFRRIVHLAGTVTTVTVHSTPQARSVPLRFILKRMKHLPLVRGGTSRQSRAVPLFLTEKCGTVTDLYIQHIQCLARWYCHDSDSTLHAIGVEFSPSQGEMSDRTEG